MSHEVLAGRYQLGGMLGVGGMARVLRAHDRVLDRDVAIKLLDPGSAVPQAAERFLREARAAASLSHPNAVAVYDTGQVTGPGGDTAYIVMELVEGETLADALRRGPFQPQRAVHVVDLVLAALSAAHARGLVHRDVKPGNVLLGRDGSVKLTDFGIAKALAPGSDLTITGQVIGTPTYLSPEQAAGRPATAASDQYAAAVVLYELLAGVPPFDGEHALGVALAHQQNPVPPLSGLREGVPPHLAAAVERGLAKDPGDRFPDIAAMRSALQDAGQTLVLPRPPASVGPAATTKQAPPTPAPTPPPATRPGRSGAAPGAVGRASGRPWLLGLGVLALLALAAVAMGLLGDEQQTPAAGPADQATESPSAASQASQEPGATDAPTALPPPAAEPMAPEPAPSAGGRSTLLAASDLATLTAGLSADPESAGERGADLADTLQRVLDAGRNGQLREVERATERIRSWTADGELDTGVADLAVTLLEPLSGGPPQETGEGGDDEDGDGEDDRGGRGQPEPREEDDD